MACLGQLEKSGEQLFARLRSFTEVTQSRCYFPSHTEERNEYEVQLGMFHSREVVVFVI